MLMKIIDSFTMQNTFRIFAFAEDVSKAIKTGDSIRITPMVGPHVDTQVLDIDVDGSTSSIRVSIIGLEKGDFVNGEVSKI